MKVTIEDIARITGFSKATISLVLNNSEKISISTKKKVREAIAKLGYQPNLLARSFAKQKAMTIGLVLPRVKHHLFSDPYFSEAISGLSDGINGSGYRLLFLIDENVRGPSGYNLFSTRSVDGYIFLGATLADEYIVNLSKKECPVLLINNLLNARLSYVNIDNFTAAKNMVFHLYNLGYRRIAFLRGIETTLVGYERYKGFLAGMQEVGLKVDKNLVFTGDFTEDAGYNIIKGLHSINFDALFAANDLMAIGALTALKEKGLEVPRDVGIVGADDIALGRYVSPKLTTIHQPIYEAARYAAQLFIKALETGKTEPVQYTFNCHLVIRESCGMTFKKKI